MIAILGIFGTLALALGGIPQLLKSIHDGHAFGLASGTLWSWIIGFAALLPYVLITHPDDLILCGNYILNFMVTLILFKYRYWPRKVPS